MSAPNVIGINLIFVNLILAVKTLQNVNSVLAAVAKLTIKRKEKT